MRNFFQQLYDYLWDRYGLLIGYYRLAMIAMSGVTILFDKIISIHGKPVPVVLAGVGITFFIQSLVIWWFYYRDHMAENELQIRGKFNALNALALKAQEDGHITRIVTLFIAVFFIWLIGLILDWSVWVSFAFFFLWSYTREVMVRERDSSRFESRQVSLQGT